jgi:aminopeptidase-like protein
VFEAARRAGLEGVVAMGRDVVKDDFAVFFDAGCPAVNLIDFQFGSAPGKNDYWHTGEDRLDKISEESLLKSGMIAAELLNMLEGNGK